MELLYYQNILNWKKTMNVNNVKMNQKHNIPTFSVIVLKNDQNQKTDSNT